MILDSRTLQSTPESGARGGYDGAKRRKGSKVHAAVDTLGHPLVLHVTAADEQDRAQVDKLAEAVQEITCESIELAYVDQGYTGENTACGWKSSSIPRSNTDLCCYRAAGWWSGASPGPPDFAAWQETTNDSHRPWQRSTISPSPSSCSLIWPGSSHKVHNRI